MLDSEGFSTAVSNVYRLACVREDSQSVDSIRQLKRYFHRFLTNLYPGIPVNAGANVFVQDEKTETALASAFQMDEALGNPNQKTGFIGGAYPPAVRDRKIRFAREALTELLCMDDDLRSLFDLVVHSVIIRESKPINGSITHASSAATAVGVIWMSAIDTLDKQDIQEVFIHELVHQLLFIDDFVHSQYDYTKMSEEQNCASAAISGTIKPLDIVIHSIVVAAEIVAARHRILGEPANPHVHPRTAQMLPTIMKSYESVISLDHCEELVTPHIRAILERSIAKCQRAYSV